MVADGEVRLCVGGGDFGGCDHLTLIETHFGQGSYYCSVACYLGGGCAKTAEQCLTDLLGRLQDSAMGS